MKLFDVICLVETWADESDTLSLEGFTEPFASVREKQPNAWRNSGGIAIFVKNEFIVLHEYCCITRLASLSDTRNLVRLKFDFVGVTKGVPIICSFTYVSSENSSVHAEEDMFQIIEDDIAAHRSNYENYCLVLAGDFNAYTERELDYIQYDESFDLLDNLGYTEDIEPPRRNNQDRHELNAYGRELLNMCIHTGLRIVNGRYGIDSDVGTFT